MGKERRRDGHHETINCLAHCMYPMCRRAVNDISQLSWRTVVLAPKSSVSATGRSARPIVTVQRPLEPINCLAHCKYLVGLATALPAGALPAGACVHGRTGRRAHPRAGPAKGRTPTLLAYSCSRGSPQE